MDNLDRRALLTGTAAIGGSELLPYARSANAVAAPGQEDPVLALHESWREAEARVDAAQLRLDTVSAGYVRTPEPEALCWRESDRALLGDALQGRPEMGSGRKPTGRLLWSSPKDIEAFRYAVSYLRIIGGGDDRTAITERQIERLDEIIAADEQWHREARARWEAAGMGEAERALDEASEAAKAVRLRIVQTPASSMAGAMFKVRVAAWCFDNDAAFAAETLWCEHEPTGAGEDLAASAFVDLMRLSDESEA